MNIKNKEINFDDNMYGNELPSSLFKYNLLEDFPSTKSLGVNSKIYKINKHNYRSDDFKSIHNGLHILFLGCSETMGIGVEIDELWTTKLLSFISKNNTVSGHFNLGRYGYSSYDSIHVLFKYIKEFGMPDIIFYNMPNYTRLHKINKNNFAGVQVLSKDSDQRLLDHFHRHNIFTYFQSYNILEIFCKTNKINLFSFSWDINDNKEINTINDTITNKYISTNDLFIKIFHFSTFYPINHDSFVEYLIDCEINKYSKYGMFARDGEHFGTYYHDYWANHMFDIYSKECYN